MLQRLSDHIQACYQRAADAEELAVRSDDAELKSHYLDTAQRWIYLAQSYEFAERLERFLLGVDKISPPPPPPANWRPIASAPFDRNLRLAVVSIHGVAHALAFPTRRVLRGWIDADSREPIQLVPTHWQEWIAAP